jgi:hypothetical protein
MTGGYAGQNARRIRTALQQEIAISFLPRRPPPVSSEPLTRVVKVAHYNSGNGTSVPVETIDRGTAMLNGLMGSPSQCRGLHLEVAIVTRRVGSSVDWCVRSRLLCWWRCGRLAALPKTAFSARSDISALRSEVGNPEDEVASVHPQAQPLKDRRERMEPRMALRHDTGVHGISSRRLELIAEMSTDSAERVAAACPRRPSSTAHLTLEWLQGLQPLWS